MTTQQIEKVLKSFIVMGDIPGAWVPEIAEEISKLNQNEFQDILEGVTE